MESGIYKLYWNNCDYFYIGQSSKLGSRKRQHKSKLKQGLHSNGKLQAVYNKYGFPIFEIICYCRIEKMNAIEQRLIDKFLSNNHFCNLAVSATNTTISDQQKMKLSISRTGYKSSEQAKVNISLGLLNAYKEGSRRRLYEFKGAANPFYNKKHSNETKSLMSVTNPRWGSANGRSRLVLNTESGIIHDSAKEASLCYSINPSTLMSMLSGHCKNKTNLIYV